MNNLSVASGQQTVGQSAPKPSTEQEPLSSFQAINASIDTILMQYEQLTGKVLIKDSNLAANALPITISVPQPVPKGELVRLIEASLLLNNIVLVPAQEPNSVKVININTGKNPRSEGVRLFTGPESIPEGEQVISYYMPFKYISATEALTVFQTHILPRAYTSFVPINSAQALLITESTTVIRQLVALQQLIDIPPARTVANLSHSCALTRSGSPTQSISLWSTSGRSDPEENKVPRCLVNPLPPNRSPLELRAAGTPGCWGVKLKSFPTREPTESWY